MEKMSLIAHKIISVFFFDLDRKKCFNMNVWIRDPNNTGKVTIKEIIEGFNPKNSKNAVK